MSPARSRLGAFTTVVVVLLACLSPTPSLLQAQSRTVPAASKIEDAPFAQPARREKPRIERALARGGTGYVWWPKSLVGQLTLTAVDLKTGQARWSLALAGESALTETLIGDRLWIRSYLGESTTYLSTSVVERLIHTETGEVEVLSLPHREQSIPKAKRHWNGMTVAHDAWLVMDHIRHVADKQVIRIFDFSWESAIAHQGKLYTYGWRGSDLAAGSILRRTDLATGRDELELPLAEFYTKETGLYFNSLVAASGDLLVMMAGWRDASDGGNSSGYMAFDLASRREVWRTARDSRIGRAPVQFHHPDGLGLSNPISNWNPLRRRPLLIDLVTGGTKPDPEWRDPYSLLSWHTGESSRMGQVELPIDFVTRNEHYAVALLGKASLICFDPETGLLVWKHEVSSDRAWPAITSTGNLGEYVLVPLPGGLEVFEISTGQRRVITPTDVGLTAIAEPPLPAGTSIPAGTGRVVHAKHDWWIDGLIQSLLALPLVAWGVYLLVRRRFPSRLPPRNDSSH